MGLIPFDDSVPGRGGALPSVERWDVGVDVHPDRFRLGVVVDGLDAHVAAVAGFSDAAEGRRGIDALIAVDPHHAGTDGRRYAMRALEIVGPQAAAQRIHG